MPDATILQQSEARATIQVRDDDVAGWQRTALWLAAGGLVVLYGPTLAWLWDRWTLSVWHHAHGLLIPPVVAYFAYQELVRHKDVPRTSSTWGFAVIVPALLVHAFDAGMHTQLLSAVSLVMICPGLSLLTLGVARTRAILFPLSLLAFALPIPLVVTEQIHWQLRQVATFGAAVLVPMLGIPVFVQGTTLYTAKGNLLVLDACSGFSTLYAAAAVACLTAYSASNTRRRLLVLVSAAPLAIGANVLRMAFLTVLVGYGRQDLLDTPLHPLSGVMTFALALPPLFWLGGEGRLKERP